MRTFLIKVIFFSSLLLAIVIGCATRVPEFEKENFIGSIVEKHKRLDSISGPRLLLAGGSNVAFGVNSKSVEDSFHLPVVNMSLHAGLGLDFVLGELKATVRKGDVVLLVPEYFAGEGRSVLKELAAYYYAPSESYTIPTFEEQLDKYLDGTMSRIKSNKENLIKYLRERARGKKDERPVYNRYSFNEYGDMVAHLNEKKLEILKDGDAMEYQHWDGIAKINAFAAYCKAKDVKLMFTYPTYAASCYEKNKPVIAQYHSDIVKEMHIPVVGVPADFVYPDEEYYDTVYHLRKDAREKRTAKLIALLKEQQVLMN
ncbi:hypothetical protein [Chitinophaga pinensis]|uniref:Lipoprotein n=1 Tax=Chitinophaga pinensis TaxID=79329 RepID=A0A5C6LU05_9BACT|nr:hypothetical protein [Chitinophaga pinensis]TWV99268.1 hypothetical protein FEF09_17360 [Chitinophaga pinensis]